MNYLLEDGMAETVEELTITYEEDGIETVKELDKKVLTKGAWSTVIYRYQDWNRSKEEYGPDKYSIRRYQKRNGQYQPKPVASPDLSATAATVLLVCLGLQHPAKR